jgi:flagellar biosynthetic protein FliS
MSARTTPSNSDRPKERAPRKKRTTPSALQPSTSHLSTAPDLTTSYGRQVNSEFSLISTALFEAAAHAKVELSEGDLDALCRRRQRKITLHQRRNVDDKFDRLRRLNMLFEACLAFLEDAHEALEAKASEDAREKLDNAQRILQHLGETLDYKNGGDFCRELGRLYSEARGELEQALAEGKVSKIESAHETIEKIYRGYLELEIRQDATRFLKARSRSLMQAA